MRSNLAADGDEALTAVDVNEYDLIILDVMLPRQERV